MQHWGCAADSAEQHTELQNLDKAAEVNALVALVRHDAYQESAAIEPASQKCALPPARDLVLAAEKSSSGRRNADVAAIWHSDGGLAVSREWIDIWTQAAAPPRTAKLESGAWTGDAATVPAQVSTRCACGGVVKRAERCVFEYTLGILRTVQPTNSLALIVRTVRDRAARISDEPKCEMVEDVNLLDDARSCTGGCPQLAAVRHSGNFATQGVV